MIIKLLIFNDYNLIYFNQYGCRDLIIKALLN